jgi:hypothetical protein
MYYDPPDFILIPYPLLVDQKLQSLDRLLYGFIYWFATMGGRRCTASNQTFAKFLEVDPGSIQNSLGRLQEGGYIKRLYKDESRRVRSEIVPLITFRQVSSVDDRVSSAHDTHVSSVDVQTHINTNTDKLNRGEATPRDLAQSFFKDADIQNKIIATLIEKGIDESTARQEIKKFIGYWTESNGAGTRQRWQLQQTFDVRRRLATWFGNVSKFERSSKRTIGIV